MNIKHSNKLETIRPTEADDFTAIHGIGAGIENRLHTAGILTYLQLAELNPDRIAVLLGNLVGITPKRIADQDWVGQAQKLSAETSQPQNALPGMEDSRQHYEMFSIEFLLDGSNQVRRTRLVHSQSKAEISWAGWDEERLLDTIIHASQLRLAVPGRGGERRLSEPLDPADRPPEKLLRKAASNVPLIGELSLRDLEVLMEGASKPSGILRQDQDYRVNLTLDLSRVNWPADTMMEYKATIYARDPGGASQHTVGTARGLISHAESVTIQISGASLPVGVYRLEAVVALGDPSGKPVPGSGLMAMLEGGLLQVY